MAGEGVVGGKEGNLGPAAFLTLQDTVNLSYRVEEGSQSSSEEVEFYLITFEDVEYPFLGTKLPS